MNQIGWIEPIKTGRENKAWQAWYDVLMLLRIIINKRHLMEPMVTANLPEILNDKELTFLAIMKSDPDLSISQAGKILANTGIYHNDLSAHNLLRNPVVRTEYDNIQSIRRENGTHLTIKSQLLTDRELNRIAKLKVGTLDNKDERWIDRGFKASPSEIAQTNIQVNIEDRRRALKQQAAAVRLAGGSVLVKEDI